MCAGFPCQIILPDQFPEKDDGTGFLTVPESQSFLLK